MFNLARVSVVATVLFAGALPGPAITAPPPLLRKPAPPKMVDARVNLKASFQQAVSARALAAKSGLSQAQVQAKAIGAAVTRLKRTMPGLQVTVSEVGGLSAVGNRRGALTPAAPGRKSEEIVRGFLGRHGDLYGLSAADLADLVALGDSPGGTSQLRMLRMEQQIDGLPVFQSETRFLLDRDGRLLKSLGAMVPHARSLAAEAKAARFMDPAEAVSRLMAAEGRTVEAATLKVTGQHEGGRLELTQDAAYADYIAGPLVARKVLFPLAPGLLVPAWSLVVFTTGEQDWYAMVDAETGALLWRKGIRDYASAQDARFRVYVQADGITPADSPAPMSPSTATPGSGTQAPAISPTIVSMHTAYDPVASQNGWIDDCPGGGCTANQTQTLGNNVLACMDQVQGANANICDTAAATVLDGNGRPTGNPDVNGRNRDFLGTTPRDFQTNFLPPPQAGNPESGQTATGNGSSGTAAIDQFRRAVVSHLFYSLNWYHDRLYRLGFDEAAGNFQQTNFTGMGVGGDRVLADVDDGSGTNNANFSTPPDGTSGRMQMYRFTGPTIDRDGALDAQVFLHEATHGVSNRLVGNGAGLNWDPAGGMGEGWSDFVALSLLNNTNASDPNARYAEGGYATYKLAAGYLDNYVYGIRRFPYSTDNSVNPMTWADVDDVTNNLSGGIAPDPLGFNNNGALEVHNTGEVWALTLWEVRSRIIGDPAGANGDVPTGNHTMLQLVIDGLKMTPVDPNFTDARDALLDADCATNACANEDSIWNGFADRGLGYGAAEPYHKMVALSSTHVAVHESFSVPFLDVVNPATDVAVDDSADNNNGAIDPGEAVKLTITLTNPWRGAAKSVAGATATLSTSTPGVTVYNNSATYGAIAPQGTASGTAFTIGVDPSVVCGSAIDFTLTTVSSLGTTSATFRLRVGAANGTDPVVTYTATPNVAIPDARPRGVISQLNVTDDFQIADLNYSLDSVTHTFVDDLLIMLRSPNGLGTDMVGLIGLDTADGGDGDNLTNFVVDDSLTFTAANDMIEADDTHSPGYTGSWVPVYNSPAYADPTFFGLPAESVGLLSRFNGTSTKGTWSTLASDEEPGDTGTLNTWSLQVTPVHFDCVAFLPAASLTATKTVSGTFTVGGTVTYTVTITNNGTGNQADNAGHEFTDTLPAGLTLTGASATSGTAAPTGNTVNWDGSLAPLGGSVTITITATVNSGTQGTTISNQGTVSYDSNNDGTNDATLVTDDPNVGGTADPTTFVVPSAMLTGTKTVSGTFKVGGTVTYTIVLSNSGGSATPDDPGNEMTDVLPSSLTLLSATATSGTAATSGNTATWNGSVPAGGSVTITITARINSGAADSFISNQATFAYDSDLNGTNDSTGMTDDPSKPGASDPTTFAVAPLDISEIPTLSEWGLMTLGAGLLLAALVLLRRRPAQA
jgi:uncharacterized repeat protein (TIGR01451 family)